MGKRELVALLNLSLWCLVMVAWLFLAVPWGCLRFVIVVFPDHNHLLFWVETKPFVENKSKSKKVLQYLKDSPYSTEFQWDIYDLPFVQNKDYQY